MVVAEDKGEARLRDAAKKYCNWGKWGPDDQLGTVNYVTKDDVARASKLVRDGRVFSLAIPFGDSGPQSGGFRRFNPMMFMLRDGAGAALGTMGTPPGIGGADDIIMLATHGATHWDALSHIFFDAKMWNGYPATDVNSWGAKRNDIANYKDKIVGRGVLLDLPRSLEVDWCEPGLAITDKHLTACAASQGVEIRRGDFLLIRTGQINQCRTRGSWGDYAGGDSPGLAFDTLDWLQKSEIAGLATDTWGVEVRPNEFPFVNQPWHRIAVPQLGLLVGEMFDFEALAADSAKDHRYEFFFMGEPLPVTGSVGGPVNPIAIK
jgi:kynurenine formamidase